MATMIERKNKTRKEWVAPELKKTSIEDITAMSSSKSGSNADGINPQVNMMS